MMILYQFSVACLPHVIDALNVFRADYNDAVNELLVNCDGYIPSSSNIKRDLKT